jgi:probable HAF family extracellular repeat protein
MKFWPRIVAALVVLTTPFAAAQTTYKITNLGDLGFPISTATAINDNGDVAGTVNTAIETKRAFLWTKAGGLKSLGTLGGGGRDFSAAYGINSFDEIVGLSSTYIGVEVQGFLWSEASGMQQIPAYVWGINDQADIVGYTLGGHGHATIAWSSSIALSNDGYLYTQARAVNTLGFVVGFGEGFITGIRQALLWTPSNEIFTLGTLGGRTSQAFAVSSNGFVAGWSETANKAVHPFVWSLATGTQDLGLLNGYTSCIAYGVNSSGVVVGQCTGGLSTHAFIWDPENGMQDLNNMVVSNTFGTLSAAAAINSSGQIAATAGLGYPSYAVILNPEASSEATIRSR